MHIEDWKRISFWGDFEGIFEPLRKVNSLIGDYFGVSLNLGGKLIGDLKMLLKKGQKNGF
jgi:hypothetical protein